MDHDLALDRTLHARRKLGSIVAAVSGALVTLGLVLSSQIPEERRMSSNMFEAANGDWFAASQKRHEAQFQAFACLGFGAVGVLAGLSMMFGSNRGGARVLYLDEELRAEARARGMGRGLQDTGLMPVPMDRASQPPLQTDYRAMASSANPGDVASRLRTLEDLHAQGLLAAHEYAEKRREILDSL